MAEGEILEEEVAVTPEEGAATQEVEIRTPYMTNFRDNNPRSSKEIAESQKHLCRNGASIGASIDSPRK